MSGSYASDVSRWEVLMPKHGGDKASVVSCFSVMMFWLSAIWIIMMNIWSCQRNERLGVSRLGWSSPLHAGSGSECHLWPADTQELALEGGIAISSWYCALGSRGLPVTHVCSSWERVFPWYFTLEVRCFLSPFLMGIFPYVMEGRDFFFFLLIWGSYWIQTDSSLNIKHLTFGMNYPAQRHLADVRAVSYCSGRAAWLAGPLCPWVRGRGGAWREGWAGGSKVG